MHRGSQEGNGVQVSGKDTVFDENHAHFPYEGPDRAWGYVFWVSAYSPVTLSPSAGDSGKK
jgi:hypothetical protein